MDRIIKFFFAILIFVGFTYVFWNPIKDIVSRIESEYLPCKKPIAYSISSFDSRFGISEDILLDAIAKAEAVWESPISLDLFEYKANGDLKISLIYDYRQQATSTLQAIGIEVKNTRASYDSLKGKYEAMQKTYAQEKVNYLAKVSNFETKQGAYEAKVSFWNARGGAPKKEYEILQQEKNNLEAEFSDIQIIQERVNKYVDDINAMVVVLNRLVASLNLNVARYNEIGASQGEEFQEGLYQRDNSGQKIEIYEFSDRDQLVRVLAHELGHALGLDHVSDPNAIMYKLNQGEKNIATMDDLDALKTLCKIK